MNHGLNPRRRPPVRAHRPITARWSAPLVVIMSLSVLALIAALVYLLLGPLAERFIQPATANLSTKDRLDELESARGLLLQVLGGLVVTAGLVATLGTLRYTARTYRVTEQGHVTDRFSKAVEQLGSDRRSVRTGGVYALGRIMKDSPEDHETVVHVLTAFIREQALHPSEEEKVKLMSLPPAQRTHPQVDIAAALSMLRTRDHYDLDEPIDLSGAYLHGANLRGADLRGANLGDVDMWGADLKDAVLDGARLYRANLRGATLSGATLISAHLTAASLPAATFTHANLTSADLSAIEDFSSASFTDATLMQADFSLSKLKGARFVRTNFTGAFLSQAVLWGTDLSKAVGLSAEGLVNAPRDGETVLPASVQAELDLRGESNASQTQPTQEKS